MRNCSVCTYGHSIAFNISPLAAGPKLAQHVRAMRHLVILIGALVAVSSAGCWQDSTAPSIKVICMDDELAGEPDCDRLPAPAESAALDLSNAGGLYGLRNGP
jgi:hypothetical protein